MRSGNETRAHAGQIQNVGPIHKNCARGVWGRAPRKPRNFESLHALKCVLGVSEPPFCACVQ